MNFRFSPIVTSYKLCCDGIPVNKPNPLRGGDGRPRISSGEEKMAGLPGRRQSGFFISMAQPDIVE
jgi:hypothetical protein